MSLTGQKATFPIILERSQKQQYRSFVKIKSAAYVGCQLDFNVMPYLINTIEIPGVN